jgi:hypothetical protein
MNRCIQHVWIPERGKFSYGLFCGQCREARRVVARWRIPYPASGAAVLGEAIDRGVVRNDEVMWGGRRLR